MSSKFQKYAPIGLIVAALAILVALGAYILQRQFTLVVQISLVVAVLGLAANILMDVEGTRRAFTGRQAKYGSNALLLSLAFLGVVIVANYLVFQNNQNWDLTENQENSLAPETIETIAKLPEEVRVVAFFTSRNISRTSAEDLFKRFVQSSDRKISYEFIDPETNPGAATQAGFSRDGDIFLYMGDSKEKADFASEQELTGALIRLISGGTQTVYFLSGHGEYDPESTGDRSYSQVKQTLESKNYSVKSLSLLTVSTIPEDADILVIAGPRQALAENEVNLVRDYVANGGKLFVLLDTSLVMEVSDTTDPLAEYLAEDLGVLANDTIIIDLVGQSQLGNPYIAVGASYGSHPIGRGVGNFATLFQEARSLSIRETATGSSPTVIVSTSDQAWAEVDLADLLAGNAPEPEEGVDAIGPLPLMVAVENFTTTARVVVVGDSDFAGNDFIRYDGNSNLFVNSVDWVAGQEDLIELTPKSSTQRTLNLPDVPYMTGLIILVALVIFPGVVLVIGIWVAVSRKRRG
jgi:ABC-type uncharacterized transport system involved in gliding motility auxiliary subunit